MLEMLLETLAKQSGVDQAKLRRIANTASRRYKVYKIPKRTRGERTIEHPSRELKAIQRWIVKSVFEKFPIHVCATAYKKGASIRANADRHLHSNYTTRYDFLGFFPSFRQDRLRLFLNTQAEKFGLRLSEQDIDFVGKLVCRNGRLTIGAPSSPVVSNVMMYYFDQLLSEFCEKRQIVYTRYADDVFVSSKEPNLLVGIEDEIRRVNRSIDYLALRINHRKTAYLSRRYGRRIAGVVITPDRKLSIGRNRKREIKSLVHRWLNGELSRDHLAYLRGLLAFARDVEPEFELRLRKKYGEHAIHQILHAPVHGSFKVYDGDYE